MSACSSEAGSTRAGVSANEVFSNRFGSILFSLYNPQIEPVFDPMPKKQQMKKKKYDIDDEIAPFESPLCSFKVKTDMEDDNAEEESLVRQFNARSKVLVSELSKAEYDIEISMIPYDVERNGADRMSVVSPSKMSCDAKSYVERNRIRNGK